METDKISIKLSKLYLTSIRAKKFAEPYAERMRAAGYKVRVRSYIMGNTLVCAVDVFRKERR